MRDDTFVGIYGNRNCIHCRRPYKEHDATRSYHCPSFTTPQRIRTLWESFGTRPAVTTVTDCPCGQCQHN